MSGGNEAEGGVCVCVVFLTSRDDSSLVLLTRAPLHLIKAKGAVMTTNGAKESKTA